VLFRSLDLNKIMRRTVGFLSATFFVAILHSSAQGQTCPICTPTPPPPPPVAPTETYQTLRAPQIDLQWDVYTPTATQPPWPAVLVLHAGGFVSGAKEDPGVMRVCTDLAQAGFLALAVNYRLAGKPTQLPTWQKRIAAYSPSHTERQIDDVMAAVHAARNGFTPRTHGHVTGWVGAVGASSGASHALYCSTQAAGDRLDSAVLLSGAYDFADHDSLQDMQYKRSIQTYCDSTDTAFLGHESPINLADPNTTAPLLFFAADTCQTCSLQEGCCPDTMPFNQFENLETQLSGCPDCDPEPLPTGGHAFDYWNMTIPGTTSTVRDYAISFLRDHLP